MVKGTLKRTVRLENMEYIPKDGQSYPLYIKIANPPYTELIIKLSFVAITFDGITVLNTD
jgi:hypothetical protein